MHYEEKFRDMAAKSDLAGEYEDVQKICKDLQMRCASFAHNPFQAFVGLKIAMTGQNNTVVQLPSGPGKSFEAAIIAEQFRLAQETTNHLHAQLPRRSAEGNAWTV